jgi:hypothetical protein
MWRRAGLGRASGRGVSEINISRFQLTWGHILLSMRCPNLMVQHTKITVSVRAALCIRMYRRANARLPLPSKDHLKSAVLQMPTMSFCRKKSNV